METQQTQAAWPGPPGGATPWEGSRCPRGLQQIVGLASAQEAPKGTLPASQSEPRSLGRGKTCSQEVVAGHGKDRGSPFFLVPPPISLL